MTIQNKNRPSPLLRKTQAFSLVEILIAMTVLGLISVGLAKLFLGASQQSAQVSRNVGSSEMRNRLSLLLGRPDICAQIFSTLTIDPLSGTPLTIPEMSANGSSFVKVGDPIGPGLGISEISLTIDTGFAPIPAPDPDNIVPTRDINRLFATFDLKTQKLNNEPAMSKDYDIRLPLDILIETSTNKITHCSSNSSLVSLFPIERTCKHPMEVMTGIGPEGPVCEANVAGTGGRLPYNQDAPPNSEIMTCAFLGAGSQNVVEKSCKTSVKYQNVQRDSRCLFEGGGWRYITGNKKTVGCTEGVSYTDSSEERNVGRYGSLPTSIDPAIEDVFCNLNTGVRTIKCEATDKTSSASAKSDAQNNGRSSCYLDPNKKNGWGVWIPNANYPTKTTPKSSACNLGLSIMKK